MQKKQVFMLALSVIVLFAATVGSETGAGWVVLFDGENFDHWRMDRDGGWIIDGEAMKLADGGYIWTTEKYGDFVLDLEFKITEDCNSGVFFRTGDLSDVVQTGMEMQIIDSAGKENPDKHDSGALYDLKEPSVNAMKPAGEWNECTITCSGSLVTIVLNGETVVDADLEDWDTAGKNPDGTDNKFNTALSEFPRSGYIGFQDHGHPVWFRNVKIKPM